VWALVEVLLGQPVVTVTSLAGQLNVGFAAANAAVATLVELGVLRPQKEQRRNRVFQAHEVLNLLNTGLEAVIEEVARLQNYGPTKAKVK
jgi:predicted transcriptional regulator